VLKKACDELADLQAKGYLINFSVNISANQVREDDFADMFSDALQSSKVDSKYLTLELTESQLLDNPDIICTLLTSLKNLGVTISIDDFGTGYSSLSYLRKLPVNELKIDRTFIENITDSEEDLILVSAIINLAHTFRLKVVAEGVENKAQLELLKKIGADQYQGFYCSKAIPLDELVSLITSHNHPPKR
jgi:EAL domain-containing protein (putative c-di-GMP-specific phosphodiesterase class I)